MSEEELTRANEDHILEQAIQIIARRELDEGDLAFDWFMGKVNDIIHAQEIGGQE